MKKNELAQIIPLYATDRMIQKAKADKGTTIITRWGSEYVEYDTALYLMARHEREHT